jgi:hypothetical protein
MGVVDTPTWRPRGRRTGAADATSVAPVQNKSASAELGDEAGGNAKVATASATAHEVATTAMRTRRLAVTLEPVRSN